MYVRQKFVSWLRMTLAELVSMRRETGRVRGAAESSAMPYSITLHCVTARRRRGGCECKLARWRTPIFRKQGCSAKLLALADAYVFEAVDESGSSGADEGNAGAIVCERPAWATGPLDSIVRGIGSVDGAVTRNAQPDLGCGRGKISAAPTARACKLKLHGAGDGLQSELQEVSVVLVDDESAFDETLLLDGREIVVEFHFDDVVGWGCEFGEQGSVVLFVAKVSGLCGEEESSVLHAEDAGGETVSPSPLRAGSSSFEFAGI